MMLRTILLLLTFVLVSTAQASESDSPAMQLAKRVAVMENSRDLPSRAVWLSNRVIRNNRELAYVSNSPLQKKPAKRPDSLKN